MCIIESNAPSSRADFLMILRIIIEFGDDILTNKVIFYKEMTACAQISLLQIDEITSGFHQDEL